MAETSQKSEDLEVAEYQEVRGPSVLLVRGVECEFLDFPTDAIQRSDSTNRISSTSSSDPRGRGRDRGGLTAK